ncbi:predicted protein [Sclerotinia sclerotiorum 1980 UF-70]|uniref:Uncharacterized protein n=1 Tax=Sclerotinia sclerotiorum (strain ATCC 18683 / 1980 / Ss-1) TaxID=665079 RepID=A7ES15_SCLS1|nr:predicted protein [Sclerotinia sclerotiorum 1980 UF-70]EDN92257.1 predicted protein [Sclerotinia sclerotiorum 1980 UF-70]
MSRLRLDVYDSESENETTSPANVSTESKMNIPTNATSEIIDLTNDDTPSGSDIPAPTGKPVSTTLEGQHSDDLVTIYQSTIGTTTKMIGKIGQNKSAIRENYNEVIKPIGLPKRLTNPYSNCFWEFCIRKADEPC